MSDAIVFTTVFNAYKGAMAFNSSQSSEFRSIRFSLYMRRSAVKSIPVMYDPGWENQIVSHTTLSLKTRSKRSRSWPRLYVIVDIGVIESDTTISRFVAGAECMRGPIFEYEILVVHSGFSVNVDYVLPEFAGLSLNSLYDPEKMVCPFPLSKMVDVQIMY